jgi:RNA polymerase sigma-70 factor (ECF subfamily)
MEKTSIITAYEQRQKITYFVYLIVKNIDVAEEIVQDQFVKVLEGTLKVEGLLRAAINQAINYYNHVQLIKILPLEKNDIFYLVVSKLLSPADAIAEKEVRNLVLRFIKKNLQPLDFKIFQLFYYKGLSFVAIAKKLGMKANTVRTRHFRALARLRRKLQ